MFYLKPCYNEPCYKELSVYHCLLQVSVFFASVVCCWKTNTYRAAPNQYANLGSLVFLYNYSYKSKAYICTWITVDFKQTARIYILFWLCSLKKYCPLRKHAYSNILKILPPENVNFQRKNPIFFHISTQNIDCGYSLEPPRRGGSNKYPQSMFWAEIRKIMFTPVNPSFTI